MGEPHDEEQLETEDLARAHWYALLSRLFYAPADAALLQELARADGDGDGGEEGNELLEAWNGLRAASEQAEPEAVREEFDAMFIGTGKAQVTPYTSAYASPVAPDRHVVSLRTRLGELGLARRDQVFEVEDHVSAVCDVMRWLIEDGRALEEQQRFFSAFLDPATELLCDAIERVPDADFYGVVGRLARAFFRVEKDGFDLHLPA